MNKIKLIFSSACAASVSIATITIITIGAEISAPFKNWLAGFTGHHWMTKSWISILAFGMVMAILCFFKKTGGEKQTKIALLILEIVAILGFISILGFYFYEYFTH